MKKKMYYEARLWSRVGHAGASRYSFRYALHVYVECLLQTRPTDRSWWCHTCFCGVHLRAEHEWVQFTDCVILCNFNLLNFSLFLPLKITTPKQIYNLYLRSCLFFFSFQISALLGCAFHPIKFRVVLWGPFTNGSSTITTSVSMI